MTLLVLEGRLSVQAELNRTAQAEPELFFQAAFRLMESMADSPDRVKVYQGLLGCPSLLLELTRKERFGQAKLIEICRRLASVDPELDIRLAHLLPGRWEDPYRLPPEMVARILDILDKISVGPRLILPVSHLIAHPHPAVAEKTSLLIGRRIRNSGWTLRRLESGGPEVRAGVVQGMWGLNTPEARRTMRKCLQDANHRVVGNAVFGLHLLQEPDIPHLVERMMGDERPPFRATAAWLVGQIGAAQFSGLLARARYDRDASVRLAAKQAMVTARQSVRTREELEAKAAKSRPKTAPPTVEKPKPKPKPKERQLSVRLDGRTAATRWD
jgi:hypothetical protein